MIEDWNTGNNQEEDMQKSMDFIRVRAFQPLSALGDHSLSQYSIIPVLVSG